MLTCKNPGGHTTDTRCDDCPLAAGKEPWRAYKAGCRAASAREAWRVRRASERAGQPGRDSGPGVSDDDGASSWRPGRVAGADAGPDAGECPECGQAAAWEPRRTGVTCPDGHWSLPEKSRAFVRDEGSKERKSTGTQERITLVEQLEVDTNVGIDKRSLIKLIERLEEAEFNADNERDEKIIGQLISRAAALLHRYRLGMTPEEYIEVHDELIRFGTDLAENQYRIQELTTGVNRAPAGIEAGESDYQIPDLDLEKAARMLDSGRTIKITDAEDGEIDAWVDWADQGKLITARSSDGSSLTITPPGSPQEEAEHQKPEPVAPTATELPSTYPAIAGAAASFMVNQKILKETQRKRYGQCRFGRHFLIGDLATEIVTYGDLSVRCCPRHKQNAMAELRRKASEKKDNGHPPKTPPPGEPPLMGGLG